MGYNRIYHGGSSPTSTTGSSTSYVTVNSALIGKLNAQATANGWNRWVLNANGVEVTFKVNDYKGFSLSSQPLLLPDLAEATNSAFEGWFTDPNHTVSFTATEVTKTMTLYGIYEVNFTVEFDGNGGTVSQENKTIKPDQAYGALPSANKTGYTFDGWFTEKEEGKGIRVSEDTPMNVSNEHALYAHWTPSNYTISFAIRGGDFIEPITSEYLSVVSLPNISSKGGCIIIYWADDKGEKVSWNFTVPASDVTLYGVSSCKRIRSAEDLVDFSRAVNSGTTFEEQTVLLDADINFTEELSNQFEPIGKDEVNFFIGTFDGQGHVISNLNFSSSAPYVGLFGYSTGLIIKNTILDSSCTLECSFAGANYAYAGGFLGNCPAINHPCTVESSINMGNVTFSGSISNNLGLGGLVGTISAPNFDAVIKNCANYGTVEDKGSYAYNHIGGITGSCGGSTYYTHILNCANFGPILVNSKSGCSSCMRVGGIIGCSGYLFIKNCLSIGLIKSSTSASYLGPIIGYDAGATSAENAYFTSTTGYTASSVTIDSTIISELNAQANKSGWNRWVLNNDGVEITFKINDHKGFTLSSQPILLPDLSRSNGSMFKGWFTDSNYTENFTATEVTEPMTLYGTYEVTFTVRFDGIEGTITVKPDQTYGPLPEPEERSGYTFVGWFTEDDGNGEMITEDTLVSTIGGHTLHQYWTINNYTISFVIRGGAPLEPITSEYLSTVSLPNNSTRSGCTIAYWIDDKGEKASWDFTVPASDVTLYAVLSCTWISNTEDLIDFSRAVNSGTSFGGKTIFIDADIDFTDELSKQFEPIGKDATNNFLGTFDGQGHVISNLIMNSPLQYVGLFGYSNGMTAKNTILDSSCSITSTFIGDYVYTHVGGFVGYCVASNAQCNIENT